MQLPHHRTWHPRDDHGHDIHDHLHPDPAGCAGRGLSRRRTKTDEEEAGESIGMEARHGHITVRATLPRYDPASEGLLLPGYTLTPSKEVAG